MSVHKLHNSAPPHLREAGAIFWRDVVAEFHISDAAGLALLTTAAECIDRMRAAQTAIAIHGEVITDARGVKINPACGLEKESRAGFLAALKALNLDLEPLRDRPGRPAGP